jgi:4-amino-4-deoxy-L-arabinose transferase-like glycosyltransferase
MTEPRHGAPFAKPGAAASWALSLPALDVTWPRWFPSPARTRIILTVGASVFALVNVAVRSVEIDFGWVLPAVAWGGAAIGFVGAFIASMSETVGEPDVPGAGESTEPAGAETAVPIDPSPSEAPPAKPADDPVPPPSKDAPAPDPLLPRGNPLRLVRGGVTAGVAFLLTLILMGHDGQARWGVPLGAVLVAVASWGVMDFLGTFDDRDDRVAATTSLGALARPLAVCAGTWVLFCLSLGLAQAGAWLPGVAWGVIVTGAFVGAVATTFHLGVALGAWKATGPDGIPLWRRHGFWVVTIAAALYFPFMGTSSLWDPWETHYGEVAREMLARDDWISLWWAQDGWFWSKPVLDMWMQAIAMATLGVHYQPDKMLTGNGTGATMHPEWAVRAPVVLLAILAMYLLYKGVARTFGRRAALLGSIVLATMPDWYLLVHQTMTDMPFVAAMTACMGLVLLGLRVGDDEEVRAYEVTVSGRRFRLTAWHLVFGSILVCALPQILYLASRNVEFLWHPGAYGFRPHWDEFRSGSGGGNCGLPGNEDCRATQPAFIPHSTGASPSSFGGAIVRLFGAFEPIVQALLWAALLALALYMSWGERRARRLCYLGAWFFAALSTLGKGPAGFGLPVLVTLSALAASRPGDDVVARIVRLVRHLTQFEVVAGLFLILPAVALPWYVAMYVRHGPPFTDRLIFHDMFNRAFHHVHDTNEGDDTSLRFYVWQLGYALFPWTGFAPLGLLWWLRRGTSEEDNARADAAALLCLWFVIAFALFSFMGTKFHHYILPAVPPVAMLIGVVLDDVLGRGEPADGRRLPQYLAGLVAGLSLLVYGVARTQPGSFFGFKGIASPLMAPSPVLGAVWIVVGAAIVVATIVAFRARETNDPDAGDASGGHVGRMLAAGAVAGALLLIVVARDLITKGESADQPGAIRLLQLYTYNYRRPWPEALDFSAAIVGFAVVATLVSLAFAVRSVRRHAVAAMCALSFVWAVWGLDVYMQKTAQHWGQHEVIAAYYNDRASPQEMLVAYQMNWKGENFYTGNHVPAFVSTGATFTGWLKKQRESGVKVMYFITEQGRIGGLKGEVAAKAIREVTDKALCNKFILVRAEL